MNSNNPDEDKFVSMKSAVTTITSAGSDQPSKQASLHSICSSSKNKNKDNGDDFCDQVLSNYIKEEMAEGATVIFKTPLAKDVRKNSSEVSWQTFICYHVCI